MQKKDYELHNAEFHFHLISMFLMNEDEVLNLLQASEDVFLSSNLNANVKADFGIIQPDVILCRNIVFKLHIYINCDIIHAVLVLYQT